MCLKILLVLKRSEYSGWGQSPLATGIIDNLSIYGYLSGDST